MQRSACTTNLLKLHVLLRPTLGQHLGRAEARAEGLELGVVLGERPRVALDGADTVLDLLET